MGNKTKKKRIIYEVTLITVFLLILVQVGFSHDTTETLPIIDAEVVEMLKTQQEPPPLPIVTPPPRETAGVKKTTKSFYLEFFTIIMILFICLGITLIIRSKIKNKAIWIGAIIGSLYGICLIFLSYLYPNLNDIPTLLFWLFLAGIISVFWTVPINKLNPIPELDIFISCLVSIVIFTLIGILVGYIIQKIKK